MGVRFRGKQFRWLLMEFHKEKISAKGKIIVINVGLLFNYISGALGLLKVLYTTFFLGCIFSETGDHLDCVSNKEIFGYLVCVLLLFVSENIFLAFISLLFFKIEKTKPSSEIG
jgi:hypothetical protein